jgi:hypothetical protein
VVGSGLKKKAAHLMGWEDILGLAVTVGLLYYLLRSMLKAEEI